MKTGNYEKFTKSNVVETIEDILSFHLPPDDALYPKAPKTVKNSIDQAITDKRPIWQALVTLSRGIDRSYSAFYYFHSEDTLDSFVERHPIGFVVPQPEKPHQIRIRNVYDSGDHLNSHEFNAVGSDIEYQILCVLVDVGVLIEHNFEVSDKVLSWFEPVHIEWAKSVEPESWPILLEAEYCSAHFVRSSIAYLAAQYRMNEYVLHDDHALGYLQRELEMLLGGVGELAESAIGVRKSAGAGGGKASSDKKNQRLFEFLEEFEKLGELLGKFTEQRLLDQAFENCVEKSPALWRQGKGQQEEYETILRSNPEFKERYFRVLGETT